MADESRISESLAAQFSKACRSIKSAIKTYPDLEWARRKKGCLPAQQIYHTIGAIDMYCGPGNFRWDGRFLGGDGRFNWRTNPENPPSRQEM